jgi:hypothetical protein
VVSSVEAGQAVRDYGNSTCSYEAMQYVVFFPNSVCSVNSCSPIHPRGYSDTVCPNSITMPALPGQYIEHILTTSPSCDLTKASQYAYTKTNVLLPFSVIHFCEADGWYYIACDDGTCTSYGPKTKGGNYGCNDNTLTTCYYPPPPSPSTPAPTTSLPTTPVPTTPIPSTPVPSTPIPSTPVPTTPVPTTVVPTTPIPTTPIPSTPLPSTPIPSTPIPSTPIPTTPSPTTPIPSTPTPTFTPFPSQEDVAPPTPLSSSSIFGIVFGVVGGVIILGGIIWFILKRKTKSLSVMPLTEPLAPGASASYQPLHDEEETLR